MTSNFSLLNEKCLAIVYFIGGVSLEDKQDVRT